MSETTTHPPLTLADFVLVVLAGLLGAIVTGGIGLALGFDDTALLIVTTIAMSALHLLSVWAILRRRETSYAAIGMEVLPADGRFLGLGMFLQIVLAVVAYPLLEVLDQGDAPTQAVIEQVGAATGMASRIAIFVLVGFLAPLAEEVVFRGVLLHVVRRRVRGGVANVITAAVFSLIHVLGLLPGSTLAGLVTLAMLFLVGLVLGALTLRHGRLGPAIFVHAGYNLTTLLLVYAAPQLT